MPRLSLLAVVFVALVAGRVSAARAEGDAQERLRRASGLLRSPRPGHRSEGLTLLEGLADTEMTPEATRALVDVLRRRPPEEGARAVALLARTPGDDARAHWLDALDGDAPVAIFLAALEAAPARAADGRAQRVLLDRVRADRDDPATRALALEALGRMGGGAARLLLSRPVGEDEPWLLAAARARGWGHIGGRASIEPLLALLAHDDPAVRVHAWEGLVAVSGQALPAEAGPWRAWWEAGGAFLEAPAPRSDPEDDPGARYRDEAPEPAHVPHYYGIPISRPRSHVVFCLDVSQSMYGRGIDQARRELTRTIKDLPTSYAFEIVAFNENVTPRRGCLEPAHPVVKHRALAWLAERETISYTNLYDAVEAAFGYGGLGREAAEQATWLDAVFLLSDGAPNRGRYRRDDKVVEAIAALSQRRIPVHAIAAGEEVFPLLQRIAEATGGRFVDAFTFD